MHQIIRFASLGAIVVASLFAAGCECQDETDQNGNTVSVCESLTRFEGATETVSLTYTDGDEIRRSQWHDVFHKQTAPGRTKVVIADPTPEHAVRRDPDGCPCFVVSHSE